MFTRLFEPVRIDPVEAPHRISDVPTDISSSHVDCSVSERDIEHNREIAKRGTGFIAIGAASPDGKTGRRAALPSEGKLSSTDQAVKEGAGAGRLAR